MTEDKETEAERLRLLDLLGKRANEIAMEWRVIHESFSATSLSRIAQSIPFVFLPCSCGIQNR